MARRYEPEQERKDFLALKGPWFFLKIKPQTPYGWWATLVWTLIIMAPALPYVLLARSVEGTPEQSWALYALAPWLLLMGLTIWASVRWMLERAEIVRVTFFGKPIGNDDKDGMPRRGRPRG